MSKPENIPAFACAAPHGHQEGMTLRDYFAGQALVGIISNGKIIQSFINEKGSKYAYDIADAMLKQRNINE